VVRVERQEDILAGAVACFFDGFEDDLDGLLVGPQVGGEATLVAHGRAVAFRLEYLLQVMEDLHADPERLGEASAADRCDHEFLQVQVVVGVAPAVDDVHEGHRERPGIRAADVPVERQVGRGGGRLGHGERDAQDGVGAQLALVGRAVQREERFVDGRLLEDAEAGQFRSNLFVHVGHGLEHAFAQVAALVAVAQFHGLVLARGSAAGHGRAAYDAFVRDDVHFQRGIAPAVEDLSGNDFVDVRHGRLSTRWVG